ncbi:putative Abi (CAAX) family protease [Saccharothrix tamanrassetensis]|uniref:Putative Abi (CAAX) family protease n=2 Tax=Saccharothrix tamanrassetensis TaxID=1051531 RepID=A0A841CQE8_9PSEU|nr:putative Abi (CAAX) family protease [Saccharothrix tamanrassetensis]
MTVPAPKKDPMKSFRGIMAGTLILEVVVVALALPVVAKLGGGIGTGTGYLVLALIVALIGTCAILKRPWALWVIAVLHLVMIVSWVALTALGAIGVLFTLVWAYLLWLRRDVARRMAEGRLPSQQS